MRTRSWEDDEQKMDQKKNYRNSSLKKTEKNFK